MSILTAGFQIIFSSFHFIHFYFSVVLGGPKKGSVGAIHWRVGKVVRGLDPLGGPHTRVHIVGSPYFTYEN